MPWIFLSRKQTIKGITFFCFVFIFTFVNPLAQESQIEAPTISVENPIEVDSPEFILSWDALEETNFYNFELCADAACDTTIREIPKAGMPTVTLKDIENGQYFWRVSGMDSNNQSGKYSTPQPLVVSILPILSKETSPVNATDIAEPEPNIQAILLSLPWYIYLIILAYLVFITRTLIWYINK